MIDPVSAQSSPLNLLRQTGAADDLPAAPLRSGRTQPGLGLSETPSSESKGVSFGDVVGSLVQEVDAKSKVADSEVRSLMLGESNNIHRSMIAMQEAGIAFNLLVEVRNKLVESYQELMRMPV